MDPTDSIASQLAEITATSEDGEHLFLLEQVTIILPDMHGGVDSPRAAAAYLNTGTWGTTHPCPVHEDCVLWSHVSDTPVSDPPAIVESLTEEEEDLLVRKASRPPLASLYKRARSAGLVSPSPQGYF